MASKVDLGKQRTYSKPLTGATIDRSSCEEQEREQFGFLAMAVHELRTPLGSLTSYAELLTDPYFREDGEQFEEILLIIAKQGRQLSQMVEAIDVAARVEIDRDLPIDNPIPLQTFMAEVVSEAKQKTGREIIFEERVGAIEINGNPFRLRYALLALLDNAAKFSPERQPVRVGARLAHSRKRVEISVVDQGIGIASDDIEVLFTRFGRIKNQQTLGIPGSGLGLFIVKRIVEQHNGEIFVTSKVGQGSTFTVVLPVIPSNPTNGEGIKHS